MTLPAKYIPSEIEGKWYESWMKQRLFRSVPDARTPYTIVIPPPNVTGILHMGHMLNNTIQDVLIRRKRMEGFNACWVPGTDHASIATEAKVVAMLREKGISKAELSREDFLKYAWEWKEKYGGIILKQLRKLGASCDWERTHFTMDDRYSEAVTQVFIDLYNDGLIYRGIRMVNWDPAGKTALSDEEVIMKETRSRLFYLRYTFVDDPSRALVVATTRPETIMADVAVAVNPDDERYKCLLGKKVRIPLLNREIPIIADSYVDPTFGTGCLKVTPANDKNDYEIGQRHRLPVIDILNEDGTLNEKAVIYVGMERMAVRRQIAKDLEAAGLVDKIEEITNTVGYSERTDAVIEPRLSMQWYVRLSTPEGGPNEFTRKALKAVIDKTVNLHPSKFENTYRHWMENVKDWCISRQLWWGHRIPAWYAPDGRVAVARTAQEAAIHFNKDLPDLSGIELAMDRGNISRDEFEYELNRRVSPEQLTQDPDVLDTWFSSWLWPIEVFKGMTWKDNEEFSYYYPTNDLVTAPEILFFWVARMIMAGYHWTGQAPFHNVYLTGIVRDKQGRKMSKSLGNSPDPLELIEQYGADGVRVGMLLSSPAGNDLLFDISLVEQGRNFANKVWNAFRLVQGWEAGLDTLRSYESQALAWMRSRLEVAKSELKDNYSKFRMSDALMTVYKLTWDDFCSWFLEIIKPAYGSQISAEALNGTQELFRELLQLLHPFMPFITEELWQQLQQQGQTGSICVSKLPKSEPYNQSALNQVGWALDAVTAIRNFRAEKSLSPKESLNVTLDETLTNETGDAVCVIMKMANVVIQPLGVTGPSIVVRTGSLTIGFQQELSAEDLQKIQDEISYLEGFLNSVEAKLSNEKFVANAKPELVERERQKKADARQKIDMLKKQLTQV